jgi:hypothetical protein
MTTIIFTEDFATRKKGDVWTCDGMLAAQLIGEDKVAKVYTGEEKTEATVVKTEPKKKGKQS